MKTQHLLCLSAAIVALGACREDGAEAPGRTTTSGPTVYFVCQVTNDQLAYLSTLIEGPAGATDQGMAASLMAEVMTLDRTQYPMPEGMTASCESSTDVRAMADRALDLRAEVVADGKAFRSITSWQP